MSTYQPPSGSPPPPEGTPGYVPPQDPWAGGYEPGLASVPTEPSPQRYDPYASYQQGDVWSQQTVAHGTPYAYVAPQRRGRAGTIVLVALAVLVLGGGGGYAAWYITTQRTAGVVSPPTSQPASSSGPVAFNPYAVKEGDCLFNKGTQKDPEMEVADCDTAGTFKVVKVVAGEQIVENDKGVFDDTTTSVAACKDTEYQTWYGYQDARDDAKDLFFCMINNS